MTAGRAASSPMSSDATPSSRVAVVPGEGFLVRRPNALFFSPVEPRDPRVAALLAAFEAAADDASASAAVTDAVVAAAFDAAPFAVISWTGGLEVVVLGACGGADGSPGAPDAVGRRLRLVGRAPARVRSTVPSPSASVGPPRSTPTWCSAASAPVGSRRS